MRDTNAKDDSGDSQKEISYLTHQITQNHRMAGGGTDFLKGIWSIPAAQAGTRKDSCPGPRPDGIQISPRTHS